MGVWMQGIHGLEHLSLMLSVWLGAKQAIGLSPGSVCSTRARVRRGERREIKATFVGGTADGDVPDLTKRQAA